MTSRVFPSNERTFSDVEAIQQQQQTPLQHSTQPQGSQHSNEIIFSDPLSSFNPPVQGPELSDSECDSEPKPKYGKKTRGRVRVKMQLISNKLRRYTTFSKRKTGIMKKVGSSPSYQ